MIIEWNEKQQNKRTHSQEVLTGSTWWFWNIWNWSMKDVWTIRRSMVFSWWQMWSEGKLLPYWQHFQKVSKTAKQCNRIHNMNRNNTTRIIWHNNWASELKGSTRPEEPSRAWRALQAERLWECGGRESAKTAGWLSSGWEGEAASSCSGRWSRPDPTTTLTRQQPHQACRSFASAGHLSLKGWPFYDFSSGWQVYEVLSLKYWQDGLVGTLVGTRRQKCKAESCWRSINQHQHEVAPSGSHISWLGTKHTL